MCEARCSSLRQRARQGTPVLLGRGASVSLEGRLIRLYVFGFLQYSVLMG